MEVKFRSVSELYDRIKPALTTKVIEMRRDGYAYIKEEDIWNYLKEVKWVKAKKLELYQMVSDILNADNLDIDSYLKQKLGLRNRKTYFDI